MAYSDIADMARNGELRDRLVACASIEGVDNAYGWIDANIWKFVAAAGWADAYGAALAAGKTLPGKAPDVVTDAMILSAVRALHSAAPAA